MRAVDDLELYTHLLQGSVTGDRPLAAAQEMLHALLESLGNAVFWKDKSSRYLGCNSAFAEFAAMMPDAIIGKSDHDMPWTATETEAYQDLDYRVLHLGESHHRRTERILHDNDEVRWLETTRVPLRTLNGEVVGLLGSFRDISERVAAQERLQTTLADLDERVRQRTSDLVRANESMRREVRARMRSEADEHQLREYAETVSDTATKISQAPSMDVILESLIDGVRRVLSADLVAVVLTDADDGTLSIGRLDSSFGYKVPETDHDQAFLADLWAVQHPGVSNCDLGIDIPTRSFGPARSTIAAPMATGGQQIGHIVVESEFEGFYTGSHAERLSAIGSHAAAVVSNLRMATQASAIAALAERQRLARDLHDTVSQSLWSLSLTAETAIASQHDSANNNDLLIKIGELASTAQQGMRTLLSQLQEQQSSPVPLRQYIEEVVETLEPIDQLQVELILEDVSLPTEQSIALARIAQEAMHNITRHANASVVSIELHGGPTTRLSICDDGVGFLIGTIEPGHIGLTTMRERAREIGGELSISTKPGQGTCIVVCLPEGGP